MRLFCSLVFSLCVEAYLFHIFNTNNNNNLKNKSVILLGNQLNHAVLVTFIHHLMKEYHKALFCFDNGLKDNSEIWQMVNTRILKSGLLIIKRMPLEC